MSTNLHANGGPLSTRRADLFSRLAQTPQWDLAVVGGGATGLGVALDAVVRGHSVVLLESHDFASGTSSRATKLLHGGVRYLAQGNVSLVREALRERSAVLASAPHLASRLAFVMPSYSCWETPFYGTGLKLYDLMAGRAGLGSTKFLSRKQTLSTLPGVQTKSLYGGVQYWDGQFDDARLAVTLARTAAREGALVLNYCGVTSLIHENGRVAGLRCRDAIDGGEYEVRARCVVNATGVWVDGLRQMDGEARNKKVQPIVAPSQGVHVVVDQSFLPAGADGRHSALLVPRTADGRVLFAVPWLGKLILGTTDTPRNELPREPRALKDEVDFILDEAANYLARAPQPSDVLSIWAGLRPLVKADPSEDAANTGSLSREHTVIVSSSGLLTVTGGKWTTYRAMAHDVLARCVKDGLLDDKKGRSVDDIQLVGADAVNPAKQPSVSAAPGPHIYGSEAAALAELPGANEEIAPGTGVTTAMVRFAARHEYAVTVADVLARRSRLLFLDARRAAEAAPAAARILEEETGRDPKLAEFLALAESYLQWPRQ